MELNDPGPGADTPRLTRGRLRRRLSHLIGILRDHRDLRILVVGLLLVDAIFIGLYAVTRACRALEFDPGPLGGVPMRITTDGGYPELFNYGKTLLVAVLAGRLAVFTRQPIHAALAAVYGMILVDDAFTLHEDGGEALVGAWGLGPVGGLRAQDLGELVIWALLGTSAAVLLAWAIRRSHGVQLELGALQLLPLAALVLFGVGVDALYGLAKDAFTGAGLVLACVEDGGEMVAITAACALALATTRSHAAGGSDRPPD